MDQARGSRATGLDIVYDVSIYNGDAKARLVKQHHLPPAT